MRTFCVMSFSKRLRLQPRCNSRSYNSFFSTEFNVPSLLHLPLHAYYDGKQKDLISLKIKYIYIKKKEEKNRISKTPFLIVCTTILLLTKKLLIAQLEFFHHLGKKKEGTKLHILLHWDGIFKSAIMAT